jgi:hypothetical protein
MRVWPRRELSNLGEEIYLFDGCFQNDESELFLDRLNLKPNILIRFSLIEYFSLNALLARANLIGRIYSRKEYDFCGVGSEEMNEDIMSTSK